MASYVYINKNIKLHESLLGKQEGIAALNETGLFLTAIKG